MENIEIGDTVRHSNSLINGGLEMNVLNVGNGQAECDLFNSEGTNVQVWFNISDLTIVHKADGGFRNAGE